MIKLTKGQVLKGKSFLPDCTVVGFVDGLTFAVTEKEAHSWYTDEELEKYFELPKEKWTPKDGDKYYFIESNGEVLDCPWYNDEVDGARFNFLGVYPTKEAAQAAADKIKLLFKNL